MTNDQTPFPPGIALAFLLFLVLLCMMLGQALGYGLGEAAGVDMLAIGEETTLRERSILRSIAAINQFFTFWVSAGMLAWLLYRRDWVREMTLHQSPGWGWSLSGAFWIVGAFPLAQFVFWFNKTVIPLPEWMRQVEESTGGLLRAFLVMESPWELLFSLFVMGVLPAVGEELVFRGFLQRFLARTRLGGHAAVWVAAVIFSAVHFQFEGFLPRVLLGALLGYLYFFTKNLWVPIAVHFANNALQVLAAYIFQEEFLKFDQASENPISWPMALASTVFAIGYGYVLWNRRISPPENPPT